MYNHFSLFWNQINCLILSRKKKNHRCNCTMCSCAMFDLRIRQEVIEALFYVVMCQTLFRKGLVGKHSSNTTAQTHKELTFCQNRLVYKIPAHYTFSVMTKYVWGKKHSVQSKAKIRMLWVA